MNEKSYIFILLINIFVSISCEQNITSEEKLNSTDAQINVPKNNDTNGIRGGKQEDIFDVLGDAITAAAAAAAHAVGSSVVNNVYGNQMITTGEYCGLRRSNRFCDDYCHDSFRGPMVGFCRSGICVCECDYYECERYCRRYWDYGDYDYDYDRRRGPYNNRRRYPIYDSKERDADRQSRQNPVGNPVGRARAYCSLRGCRCD